MQKQAALTFINDILGLIADCRMRFKDLYTIGIVHCIGSINVVWVQLTMVNDIICVKPLLDTATLLLPSHTNDLHDFVFQPRLILEDGLTELLRTYICTLHPHQTAETI